MAHQLSQICRLSLTEGRRHLSCWASSFVYNMMAMMQYIMWVHLWQLRLVRLSNVLLLPNWTILRNWFT